MVGGKSLFFTVAVICLCWIGTAMADVILYKFYSIHVRMKWKIYLLFYWNFWKWCTTLLHSSSWCWVWNGFILDGVRGFWSVETSMSWKLIVEIWKWFHLFQLNIVCMGTHLTSNPQRQCICIGNNKLGYFDQNQFNQVRYYILYKETCCCQDRNSNNSPLLNCSKLLNR